MIFNNLRAGVCLPRMIVASWRVVGSVLFVVVVVVVMFSFQCQFGII